MTHRYARILCFIVAAAIVPQGAAAQPSDPPAEDADKRARAKERFEAGVKLLEQRRFELALGEFTRSLDELPTRAATENAGVCLKVLGRLDEALVMFEKVLAFPDVPEDMRVRVEPQIAELRAATGLITVRGGEKGAVVSIDGRPRGALPLAGPLRAVAGLRTIRVHLEGYVPFVQTVDVRAGGDVEVTAKLEVLARAGRLKVTEKAGLEASVVIDGVVVGTTPWEGALAPGDHAIWLRGEHGEGTAPAKATVLLGQRSETELALEPLDADLDVQASPASAIIALDGVVVGTASWAGRLPARRVRVVVSAPGYVTATRVITLKQDLTQKLRVDLEPVAPTAKEEAPPAPRVELGASGALAVAPLFQGSTCDDPCAAGVGLGIHVEALASYRFASGFGVGGSVGWVRLQQTVEDRPYDLSPPGRGQQAGVAADEILLSAATIMASASLRVGRRFFAMFEASAGGFVGGVRDERTIVSRDSTGAEYGAGPYFASGTVGGLAALARVRGGIVVVPGFEAWIGAAPLVLLPFERPTFAYGEPIPAGADGAAALREEPIVGDVIVAVTPSIGIGAAFE